MGLLNQMLDPFYKNYWMQIAILALLIVCPACNNSTLSKEQAFSSEDVSIEAVQYAKLGGSKNDVGIAPDSLARLSPIKTGSKIADHWQNPTPGLRIHMSKQGNVMVTPFLWDRQGASKELKPKWGPKATWIEQYERTLACHQQLVDSAFVSVLYTFESEDPELIKRVGDVIARPDVAMYSPMKAANSAFDN